MAEQTKEGHVRIPSYKVITTKESYTGGFDVTVKAQTEKNNIRLHGPQGSCVIFNWESNPGELHVNRPDARNEGRERGSISTAKVTPLKPNTWYTLRWRVTNKQIDIWVDGKLWFSEARNYNLATKSTISVEAKESVVDVQRVEVKSVK